VKSGNHRARTFSTRWLFFGEGAQVTPWNAAVLFKAAELLQAKPVAVNKGSCRHAFAGEAAGIGVAWMVNAQEPGSFQEVDRQAERSQQRWLNPIDVFVSE